MSKKMKNIAQSEVLTLREQISYQDVYKRQPQTDSATAQNHLLE